MRAALTAALSLTLLSCGYPVRFSGDAPPLVPFEQLADPLRARGWLDDRVRFYAVVTGFRSLPVPLFQGQRVVGAELYGVRVSAGDPPLPQRCDFGVRTGAITALVPRGLARTWAGRAPDTVFLLTASVRMRELGVRDWSPTPMWLAVDSMTAMGTCGRAHPLVAPPGRTRVR